MNKRCSLQHIVTEARIINRLVCTIVIFAAVCGPATISHAQSSLDSAVQQSLQEFVDTNEIAGGVAMVASRDEVIGKCAVGLLDIDAKQAMDEQAIFWIASMTKPITGVAVMMLEEQGKLSLDDPVSKYLPEFKQLKNTDGQSVEVTLKQLLTHSAGLSELDRKESASLKTLAELTSLVIEKPVQFPAGSKWQYSQTAINTAARVVEVISGENFSEFLAKHLFEPLGMKDTTFYLSEEQLARLAKSYRRTDAGQLELAQLVILGDKSPTSTDRVPLANGGLFSTAGDYTRFCQMLLGDGTLAGNRILKPESVEKFSSVHSGDLVTGFTPGNAWGIGCCIVRKPQGVTEHLSPGSYGHGGAYGTQAWIDPVRERIYVLMVQRANFPNSDASPVRAAFQKAAQANSAPRQ